MSTSDVAIVNEALALIGADRIVALSDNSRVAILMNEQYAKIRDTMLEAHPWRFALATAALVKSPSVPALEYSTYFVLPTDCLRVVKTDPETAEWERQGQLLATNEVSIAIKYIKKITEPGLFSATFAHAFAAKLAAETCYAVTQSVELKKTLSDLAEKKLGEARSFSSQEGSPKVPYAKKWLNSRY